MNDFISQAAETADNILGVLVGLTMLATGVWMVITIVRMPGYRDLIEDWCAARQLRLVDMDRRWFLKGPFFLSPNGTAVFYLTVRDPLGGRRYFWARCGHWMFGMFMPEIHVLPAD
jgi:hypothetical protein